MLSSKWIMVLLLRNKQLVLFPQRQLAWIYLVRCESHIDSPAERTLSILSCSIYDNIKMGFFS